MRPPTASPARTALPAAHFDRNERYAYFGDRTLSSGVANVEGPLGDRTQKPPRDFTENGDLDKFVTWSDNPGPVLSYIDPTNLPEGQLAQQYTLCDNFFHSAYGGSFLNHQWLIAAGTPPWTTPIPDNWKSSYIGGVLSDNQRGGTGSVPSDFSPSYSN
jgi:hypothetical protein